MAKQREQFLSGRARPTASTPKAAEQDLRPDGAVRRLRLQQVALGGLRLLAYQTGLPQGALPGRVHGRAADLGNRRTPTRWSSTSTSAARWASRCCRRTSTSRTCPSRSFQACAGPIFRRGLRLRCLAIRFGLAAIRNVGEGAAEAILRARRRRVVPLSIRFLRARRPASRQSARRGELRQERLVRFPGKAARGPLCGDRPGDGGGARAPARPGVRPGRASSGRRSPLRSSRTMAAGRERAGRHPLERGRAPGPREGVPGLLHHGASPRALPSAPWISGRRPGPAGSLNELAGAGEVTIGGIVAGLRLIKTKKGDRMAFLPARGPGGRRGGPGLPRDVQEGRRTPGRRSHRADARQGGAGRRREVPSAGLGDPLDRAGQPQRPATSRSACPFPGGIARRGRGSGTYSIRTGAIVPLRWSSCDPASYAVDVVPSTLYSVRPDAVLRQEVEELVGPGALVLARTNGRR